MKRSTGFLVFFVAMFVPLCAQGATQLGLRGGYSHASGEFFEGSGDIGGAGLYGLVVSLGLFQRLDLEFAYERYTNEFEFTEAAFEGTFFDGEASAENQAYLFTGKLNLAAPASPFSIYGGGGFSLHEIDLTVESDDDVAEYIDRISGDRSDWEWHLVGGLGLRLPGLPLRAYGEFRYQNIQGGDDPTYSSVYGGLNLYLK